MGIFAFGLFMILMPIDSNAYVQVRGPSYTCPNSEIINMYEHNYGNAYVEICIGLIFDPRIQTFISCISFYETDLNLSGGYRVKWNNSPLGTIGNIFIRVCDATATFICSNDDHNVTFGASPGSPIISGSDFLLNCSNQQQSYTPVSIPVDWRLVSWNLSSNIQHITTSLLLQLVFRYYDSF